MSLMNTVAKMAVGFAVAKGMQAVQDKGGISSVLEGLSGAGDTSQAGSTGGLGDLLSQLGGGGTQGGASGGLGDLLGQLTGGGGQGGASGGLGDMLSQLTGGGAANAAAAGGLGGLGSLLGGLAGARGGSAAGDLEALINQDNPADEPDEEVTARLMLRAMTQAARADGDFDTQEKSRLLDVLRDGDPEDRAELHAILDEPVNAQKLAADTPRGLETQVYTMAVNAISPDNQAEGQFLHELAAGLGIQPDTVNRIHDGLGAPRLYS